MEALQRMNHLDVTFAYNLFEGATNFNSRLNSSAWGVLNYFLSQTDKAQLLKTEIQKWQGNNTQSIQLRQKLQGNR
jgi:hypothetical protein